MRIPIEEFPQPLPPGAFSGRLKAVLISAAGLACPWLLLPTQIQPGASLKPGLLALGAGALIFTSVVAWKIKVRHPCDNPPLKRLTRWLLYITTGLSLLPLVILAGSVALFLLYAVRMTLRPDYPGKELGFATPYPELGLSLAITAGLTGLLAGALYIIRQDY